MHMTDDALLTATLSRVAFLLVFLTVVLSQPRERFLWHWLAALIGSSLGAALMTQFPASGDAGLALSLITYFLFILSLVCSWSGIRLFYRRCIDPRLLGAMLALPLLLFAVLDLCQVALNYRRLVIALVCTLPACLTVFEIIRPASERLFSPIVVALAFTAYAVALVGTGVALVLDLTLPTLEAVNYPSFAVDRVASILVYFGYIAMAGERANRALRQQAETDQLTGLANRHSAQQDIAEAVAAGQPLTLLRLSICGFRHINDTFGYAVGDQALRRLAKRLATYPAPVRHAYRLGGDEFLLLVDSAAVDAHWLTSLREGLAQPIELEQSPLRLQLVCRNSISWPAPRGR